MHERTFLLQLEEDFPTIKYIKLNNNYAVDTLSRLLFIKSDVTESNITREYLYDSNCVDIFYGDTFLLTYQIIDKYQQKEKYLIDKLKCANYHTKYFI